MTSTYKIRDDVLLATARVQAALALVPRMLGPKEAWGPWMFRNLHSEVQELPLPSTSSPHPRLLGSLSHMIVEYFTNSMLINMLSFSNVQEDDHRIVGEKYVSFPTDALPRLQGTNFWWNEPPSSVSLSVLTPSPTSTLPLDMDRGSSKTRTLASYSGLTLKLPPPARSVMGKKLESQGVSNTRTTGTTGMVGKVPNHKGNKRALGDEEPGSSSGRNCKRVKSKVFIEDSDYDSDARPGPPTGSTLKGKTGASVAVADRPVEVEDQEALEDKGDKEGDKEAKVCNKCRKHGAECIWSTSTKALGAQVDRRACNQCVKRKTRCTVGAWVIRAARGKASQTSCLEDKLEEISDLAPRENLIARIDYLEKKAADHEGETKRMVSRISNLELQFASDNLGEAIP
ncbi:hypothetical protein PAXRUDRAFT_36960 [Paxillus rubicundulus Ve08.2h10]|uniref:Zn(2)-C6 fungal-type domain-containing protein n=1 Tax=Paxillus rubicundulus Ve08.2h10 TaxID=930991 RepID=A0A0D0CXD7_9AGAM|nr:hypothetical protein PAXRUDRAFT_36960 [Paxillus rubicundulus Ve08.2h10]